MLRNIAFTLALLIGHTVVLGSQLTSKNVDSLYKNIIPRELGRTTDIHGLKLVVPDGPAWRDLGEKIADALRDKWKIAVDVDIPDVEKSIKGWEGNTLMLGSLGNNKQMARLYGMHMSYADAVYPGKGGYQLLTLVDPFGLGGNTIIIGATDIDGAQRGVARLLEIVRKEEAAVIPWLFEAKLSEETGEYFIGYTPSPVAEDHTKHAVQAEALLEKLRPRINEETSKDALFGLRSMIIRYGEYYQLTANEALGEMYKRLLKGYAHFLNHYPVESRNQLSNRNMWVGGAKVFQNWAVLEASPLFTELERSQILSALYLTCEINATDPYLTRAKRVASRWNHEIFPAMSLVGSSDYFEKYFQMSEVLPWKQLGHQIFQGNTSYISLDEGSDYLVHVPMVTIDYAMFTGHLEYMNRSLRPSADLNAMMIDNLGTMSGGGDTYPFGMSSAYSWGHSQVMNAASWYYNDPIYNFLLERTERGPFPGQRKPDLDYPIHRYAATHSQSEELSAHYPKIQAQQVEQGVYNDLKKKEKLNVEQEDTFHKLTFRSGFGLNDNYLIVDGFSAGTHGHEDGNAILNYSANGRLFLIDRDYIQKTPEYHSGVVIVKDGEQYRKPALAKLEWAGDIAGTTISRSTVFDYNSTDWDRTIISPGGKFFLIYDDLKVNERGSFIFKNLWQSLGTPRIQGDTFSVEQKGVSLSLQSMAKADLRLKDIYGHFIKYWKTVYAYPYADHETVLTEVIREKEYVPGEKATFINILSSHMGKDDAVQSIRINEKTIKVVDSGITWFVVQGAMDDDPFQSDGSFHILGNNELLATAVTHIKAGSDELHFPVPVFFKMNTVTGEWKTYGLLKNKVKYDSLGNPIMEDSIDSGKLHWNTRFSQQLEQLMNSDDNKILANSKKAVNAASSQGWQKIFSLKEQVTSSAFGDLNGDGKDELLLAGANGTVKAIDSDGNEIWGFTANGRVNEVTVHLVGEVPRIFIATENWYVQTLDAEGKELWNYKFPDDTKHKEFKGNLIGITNVRLAYKNGKDEDPSVMVGTQFRYLYELDLQGRLKTESIFYFYGLEDIEFADFDGDGKDEGVIALEYYFYSFIKGKKIIRGNTRGPGWNIATVLNREGKNGLPSVLLGSKEREVRLVQFKDKVQEHWVRNVGGVVNAIRHGDFNDDGIEEILVGSEGFQFYVLNTDGSVVFRKSLPDRVLKVDGYRNKKKVRYMAAIAEGRLFEFSDQGNLENSAQFIHDIANVLTINRNSSPFIVLENGEVYRKG